MKYLDIYFNIAITKKYFNVLPGADAGGHSPQMAMIIKAKNIIRKLLT